LKVLRQVATAREKAVLMKKLRVVTAAAYLRRDRCTDAEAWCRKVMAEPDNADQVRLDSGSPQDKRSRAWYGTPLEGFVGKLVDQRKRCKDRADGLERVLKLMVNTLFGSVGCRHFPISNTVVANNITARGQVGVWMMSKALGLRECITDG